MEQIQKAFLKLMKTLVGGQYVVTILVLKQPWLPVSSCDWAYLYHTVEILHLQTQHITFCICTVMEMNTGLQDVIHIVILAFVILHICNAQVCLLQYICASAL